MSGALEWTIENVPKILEIGLGGLAALWLAGLTVMILEGLYGLLWLRDLSGWGRESLRRYLSQLEAEAQSRTGRRHAKAVVVVTLLLALIASSFAAAHWTGWLWIAAIAACIALAMVGLTTLSFRRELRSVRRALG